MVVPQGVEYDALDGEPVHIIFLIAAPNTEDNVHLEVLSRLSVLLMDEQFTKDLIQAKSPEDFLHVIDLAEADKEEKEEAKARQKKQRSERILLWLRLPDVLPESHILIWQQKP